MTGNTGEGSLFTFAVVRLGFDFLGQFLPSARPLRIARRGGGFRPHFSVKVCVLPELPFKRGRRGFVVEGASSHVA